jgi:O-antigen/teichoic acid export membrane protein
MRANPRQWPAAGRTAANSGRRALDRALTPQERRFHAAKAMSATLVAYKAAADLVAKGTFFFVTVLAARRLTTDEFGLFALGSTLGWMGALVSDAGLQVHVARAVARAPGRSALILRRWLPVRLTAAAALGALMLAAAAMVGVDADATTAMLLLLGAALAAGVAEFAYFFFRGLGRSDLESSLVLVQRLAVLAGAVIVLWLRPSLTGLAVAVAAPAVLTCLIATSWARRLAGQVSDLRSLPAPEGNDGERWREWRSQVLPIGAASVLSALYFRIDVVLLELWQGSAAVGLYNAVFRIVEGLRLFPGAVLAVALPGLFRATDARPLLRVASALTLSGAALSLVLWLLAPALVPALYGRPYAGAVSAFRILLAAFPLMSLNYALTHQLIGWDRHGAYAIVCAMALASNVALNAVLIPAYSLNGAAWSTLATEAMLTAACVALLAARHRRPLALERPAVAAAGPR